MHQLDIVIPVYNEGRNIVRVLDALRQSVRSNFRVLICYDHDEDDTLEALRLYRDAPRLQIEPVKNAGRGVHGAIMSGFRASTAPAILVFPADDVYNAGIVDSMLAKMNEGCAIVAASRFMRGGCMRGCPWLKALLVRTAAFTLYHIVGLPTHDPTNGFRLFSRRVLDHIRIESSQGFTYSLELLVKCHRLGWKVGEVPAVWYERSHGTSRFRLFKWLPAYLRWYVYAVVTALT